MTIRTSLLYGKGEGPGGPPALIAVPKHPTHAVMEVREDPSVICTCPAFDEEIIVTAQFGDPVLFFIRKEWYSDVTQRTRVYESASAIPYSLSLTELGVFLF